MTKLYFATKYAMPGAADDIKFVIAAIQPVFVLVIGGIAYEDGQSKGFGGWRMSGDKLTPPDDAPVK